MSTTDRTMELLGRYLDKDYTIFPMAERSSSLDDIKEIENALGVQLPEEFVAHLVGDGAGQLSGTGVFIEAKEAFWPRPSELSVGPAWTTMNGLHTYTASNTSDDWMRLVSNSDKLSELVGVRVIPLLKILSSPDVYCADTTGTTMRYEHETNELTAISGTFWDIFEHELSELAKRKEQMKATQG